MTFLTHVSYSFLTSFSPSHPSQKPPGMKNKLVILLQLVCGKNQHSDMFPEPFGVPLDSRYVPFYYPLRPFNSSYPKRYIHEDWSVITYHVLRALPLTTSNLKDWEIWTAAIVTNTGARDMLIKAVIDSASSGKGASPLRDFYETTDGSPQGFTARPVVGGHCKFPITPLPTSTYGFLVALVCFPADVYDLSAHLNRLRSSTACSVSLL